MKVRLKQKGVKVCSRLEIRFNSMKVRLKRGENVREAYKKMRFQFHEGPIKTSPDFVHGIRKACFNSMKVRLKPAPCKDLYLIGIRFNSMKVRLKHKNREFRDIANEFQFHEGPIKTDATRLQRFWFTLFQFHEGPIKTIHNARCFLGGEMFQFHEGPIKTIDNDYRCYNTIVSIP